MTDWKKCSEPPERCGMFEVQRYCANGDPYGLPEPMRFDGEFHSNDGLPVMPYDGYREIGGGE